MRICACRAHTSTGAVSAAKMRTDGASCLFGFAAAAAAAAAAPPGPSTPRATATSAAADAPTVEPSFPPTEPPLPRGAREAPLSKRQRRGNPAPAVFEPKQIVEVADCDCEQ